MRCTYDSDSQDLENLSFPIFDPEWKASEEVALLEAVELYSFGNWGDISLYIPDKTTDEIKKHFIDCYIKGNLGKLTWDSVKSKVHTVIDHTSNANIDGPLSNILVQPLPPINTLTPVQSQQLGYMVNRDDFEREYDNEVESLVAALTMNIKDEDDLDRDMNLAYIDIYNRRLAERLRRKYIVRQYDLVNTFFKHLEDENEKMGRDGGRGERGGGSAGSTGTTTIETTINDDTAVTAKSRELKSIVKEESPSSPANAKTLIHRNKKVQSSGVVMKEKKLREGLKPFYQFLNCEQLDELVKNLIKQRELIVKVKDLNRQRRSRRMSFSKALPALSSKIKKEERKDGLNYKVSGKSTGFGRKATSLGAKLNEMTPSGESKSLIIKTEPKVSKQQHNQHQQGITSKGLKVYSLDHSGRKERKESQCNTQMRMKSISSTTSSPESDKALLEKTSITLRSGCELLSEKERKLCTVLRLSPHQYINLKTLIIKEHLREREKGKYRSTLENIDENILRKLTSFFYKNGWLRYGP